MNDNQSGGGYLAIWTITEKPRDYPNCFVARKHVATAGASRPTPELIISTDLEKLREEMRRRGLVLIPREPGDDPVIVESWL